MAQKESYTGKCSQPDSWEKYMWVYVHTLITNFTDKNCVAHNLQTIKYATVLL